MASLAAYFSIRLLPYINWVSDYYQRIVCHLQSFYHYQSRYPHSDTWHLLKGHTLPLCAIHLTEPIESEWIYKNHTLTHSSDPAFHQRYTFSWLSAKIVHVEGDAEYDIDPFLESLVCYATPLNPPTLHTIFQAWCIDAKKWFPLQHMIQFHTIDNQGEEQLLSLKADSSCLVFHQQKIYAEPK